ncbi:MAG: Spy/CpxP family protein refolding chaperone [Deltaproteobacteria bacterium]|jgi:Spy/CpxP family protein refolding chaperone|nr:Spy/CpxP family protein refolding chaperone [Deltaproteobacteria bacterium]
MKAFIKGLRPHQKHVMLFVFLALILSFLAFSRTSYGFNGMRKQMHNCMHMKSGKFFRLAKELHLSKFQMRKLRKLNRINFKKMMKGRKMMKSPMIEAIKNGSFNKAVFESTALGNMKLMLKMRASRMENFYNILTPKQRKEFLIILNIKKGDWRWNNGR